MNEPNAQPQTPTSAQIEKLEAYAQILRTAAIGLEQSARLLERRPTPPRQPHGGVPSPN